MHMNNSFRRSMTAMSLAAILLLCCGCGEESSVTMPQTQSTASSDATTTTEATTTTTTNNETTSAPVDGTTTVASDSTDTTTSTTETTTTVTETTSIDNAREYLFDALTLGADCTAYVTTHTDYYLQEAASCMGEGTDRVYTYTDYILYTFFDGTTDTVLEIDLTREGVKTRLGASIGMTQAEVEAIYGVSANGTYLTEDGYLEFSYADNTVILIAVYNPI